MSKLKFWFDFHTDLNIETLINKIYLLRFYSHFYCSEFVIIVHIINDVHAFYKEIIKTKNIMQIIE